ncbi:hypothetical protein AVEN_49814-1 [Araneus ventricosus]|uniref:Secreted protein n=1 Tax=Araneus ventricosus TaxID=182803 RepID=A0A4Y2JKG5_ARAVE|nr:hypothetical protein AVEN_49814-1 [Araneus ventricosus]
MLLASWAPVLFLCALAFDFVDPRSGLCYFGLIPSRSVLARGGGWGPVKTEKEEVWCACLQWQAGGGPGSVLGEGTLGRSNLVKGPVNFPVDSRGPLVSYGSRGMGRFLASSSVKRRATHSLIL